MGELLRRTLSIVLAAGLVSTVASATTPHQDQASAGGLTQRDGDWPGWHKDLAGSRFTPAETAITPATVGRLRLK